MIIYLFILFDAKNDFAKVLIILVLAIKKRDFLKILLQNPKSLLQNNTHYVK